MSTSANGDSGDSTTRGSATPLAYFSAGGGATQSSKVIGPGGRRGVGRRTGGAAIGGVRGGVRGGGGITYGASAGDGGGARGTASRRGGDRAASSGESSGETRGGAAVSGDGSRGGAGTGFGSGAWRRRTATAAGGGAGVDVALRQQRCGGVRLQQNMIKVAGRPRNRSSCAGAALLGQPRSQSTLANLLCQGTLSIRYLISIVPLGCGGVFSSFSELFAMGATSGAEPSYGSNLARRSKLILGLSAAVLGLFLVARIVVEDILPRFGISGGSSTLRWW